MPEPTLSYERCMESASIALASGDQANAERALRAAILATEAEEDSQLELVAALNKLGTLKQDQDEQTEAEALFRRALELGERALGPEHLGLVPTLKGLGTTLILQGEAQAAEPTLARALGISERHLGEDHPDLVILINDLTRLYLKQSAFAYAEPLVLRLLEMKRHKGDDHPEVATVLASLAVVRQALGRHDDAEQLWRRVLTIRERTLAPNHFSIATALEHLAETCAARGKIRESVQLLQRAMTIRETTLGRDHASLRSSRERIADLQLQASEGAFEADDAVMARPAPRRASVENASAALARLPLERTSLPAREIMLAPTPPLDRIVAPTTAGLAMTPIKQTPLETGSYLDTLDHIKNELETTATDHEAPPATAVVRLLATIKSFVERRRAAAAVILLGVIALPLVAWGVANAARSNNLKFIENEGGPTTPRAELAGAAVVVDADSAAKAAAAKTERANASKPDADVVHLPTLSAPSVVVRVDSVRGIVAPFAASNESVLKDLVSSADLRRPGALTTAPPTRARLIGALPTPKYPRQQIRGGTGGQVRVRFDVDTLGRPVMSTFTVVGAPLAQLANAVREVVPGIRFEPARTPWPENRPIVETVELAFQFALPSGK